jgi:hypothetical protein
MPEVHPFTARIELDPTGRHQFRWTVCQGERIVASSPISYATRREAQIEAKEAMLRYVAKWRSK